MKDGRHVRLTAPTSHNPMGLHGLLTGIALPFFFFLPFYFKSFLRSSFVKITILYYWSEFLFCENNNKNIFSKISCYKPSPVFDITVFKRSWTAPWRRGKYQVAVDWPASISSVLGIWSIQKTNAFPFAHFSETSRYTQSTVGRSTHRRQAPKPDASIECPFQLRNFTLTHQYIRNRYSWNIPVEEAHLICCTDFRRYTQNNEI
jgi:hypothetical protein